ncbi:MAG: Uma2 family endonuclease [Bacteroidota bacterium]
MRDVTTEPAHGRLAFDALLTWDDVVAHPSLNDLPFRMELNGRGQVVMTPICNRHGRMLAQVSSTLDDHLDGDGFIACPIKTAWGVSVADLASSPIGFAGRYRDVTALPVAPTLCIEIVSPTHAESEMQEKVALYLAKGAQEVWLCDLDGHVRFFGPEGQRERSEIAPDVPAQLES